MKKRILFTILILVDVILIFIVVLPCLLIWCPIIGIRWVFVGGDAMDLAILPIEWIIDLPYKIIHEKDL